MIVLFPLTLLFNAFVPETSNNLKAQPDLALGNGCT